LHILFVQPPAVGPGAAQANAAHKVGAVFLPSPAGDLAIFPRLGQISVVNRRRGDAIHYSLIPNALNVAWNALRASRSTLQSGCAFVWSSRPMVISPSRSMISRHSRARIWLSRPEARTANAASSPLKLRTT